MAGVGTAILIKRNISHFHVPTLLSVLEWKQLLAALTPNDQEPFMVASIYIPPNPNYRNRVPTSTLYSKFLTRPFWPAITTLNIPLGVAVAVIQEVTTFKIYHQ
ncbi:hypothetical protein TNCV_2106941 [Trichonephila clavipes]|nr:hypothetical protein TNCV_2106941 [Trichonephila clavipes]